MKESLKDIAERRYGKKKPSSLQEINEQIESIALERLKNMDKSKLVSHKDMFK